MQNGRLTSEGVLLRSCYYFLKNKKSKTAKPIQIDGVTVYLHKEHRGFSNHMFYHKDLVCLIRILAFKYFNYKCMNVINLLHHAKQYNCTYQPSNMVLKSSSSGDVDGDVGETMSMLSYGNDYLESCDRQVNEKFFMGDNNDFTPNRVLPIITKTSDKPVPSKMSMVSFCLFVDGILGENVCTLLYGPIYVVFRDCYRILEMFKFHRNEELLAHSLCPSTYDYFVVINLMNYAKSISTTQESN